jgi:GntR family transcriptional regulator
MTEQAPPYLTQRPVAERPPFEANPSLIRRAHPVPYYAQLAELLRDAILRGVWLPGEVIPSEGELETFFGISRTVVRQALGELVADGLVNKQKGRGTFVSEPKDADLVVHEMRGLVEEMRARGREVSTEVIELGVIPAPPLVAEALRTEQNSWVVHLTRVRRVDGVPIVKVDTYLPHPRFEAVLDADLESESLYEILARECGVRARGGRRRVEAALAGRETAGELGVRPGSPLLVLAAVTEDQDGVPFEQFRAAYRGDRTIFDLRVIDIDDARP